MRLHLVFGIAMVGAVVAIDYVNMRASAPAGGLAFTDYARSRMQAARDALSPPAASPPAPDAAPAEEARTAESDGATGWSGGLGAMFGNLFGGGSAAPESPADRKSRQEALVAAAKSGNAPLAAALAAFEFNAIAAEINRDKSVPALPAAPSRSSSSRGRKIEITVGIGTCGDRGGGKFCSVVGAGAD